MSRSELKRQLCKEMFGDERLVPGAEMGARLRGRQSIEDILRDLIEVQKQAELDLCGEQRAFHLPRLRRAVDGLMKWFPTDYFAAFLQAVDAWGEPISPKLPPLPPVAPPKTRRRKP